ncbi:MAG: hypothetical protein HYU36_09240 [Planctomycetes bacterium]|nr:hypothetical protein [Planctomycetota bacterium]
MTLKSRTTMQVYAARGVPHVAPENTIISYSIANGLRSGIQIDVRVSRDGVPVCIHDATLERTTNGTGLVRSYSVEELKRFDAGGWFGEPFAREQVPTLQEALELLRGVPIAIGPMCPGSEECIVRVIELTRSVENTLVFDAVDAVDSARRIKSANPSVKVGVSCLTTADYLGLRKAGLEGIDAIWASTHSGWLHKDQVREIHADGLQVHVSFLSRWEDFKPYIDGGVDGICTDRPADLLNVLGITRSPSSKPGAA